MAALNVIRVASKMQKSPPNQLCNLLLNPRFQSLSTTAIGSKPYFDEIIAKNKVVVFMKVRF